MHYIPCQQCTSNGAHVAARWCGQERPRPGQHQVKHYAPRGSMESEGVIALGLPQGKARKRPSWKRPSWKRPSWKRPS
jgi:hypothetical protein